MMNHTARKLTQLMDAAIWDLWPLKPHIEKLKEGVNTGVTPQSSVAVINFAGSTYIGLEGLWYFSPAHKEIWSIQVSEEKEDPYYPGYGIFMINGYTPYIVRDKKLISCLNKTYNEWQMSAAAPDFMNHIPG
jgi:hypothetical protein